VLLKNINKMANQSKLKAWVRIDGGGTVVGSGPIFSLNKPKVGKWREMNANLCCNSTPTTTTTTTAGGGGVTPTAWVVSTGGNDIQSTCDNIGGTQIIYTAGSSLNGVIYLDASLTTFLSYYWFAYDGFVYETDNLGRGSFVGICTTTTTTTSTTQAPALSFVGGYGFGSAGEACFGGMTQTFYTPGPLNFIYPQTGNVIYVDQAMTQLATYAYISSPGIGVVWQCINGVLSNQTNC
jgi:hypothetical protein